MAPRGTGVSLAEARRLLDLDPDESLCKTQIQKAFVRAAQTYHPDGRHRPGAKPCAITFRKCDAARKLLIANPLVGAGVKNRGGVGAQGYSGGVGSQRYPGGTGAQGFPDDKMRALTPKQTLLVAASCFFAMCAITTGAIVFEQRARKKHTQRNRFV